VLKLQVEEVEDSQERVLTCFLFPQERLKAASLGKFHVCFGNFGMSGEIDVGYNIDLC